MSAKQFSLLTKESQPLSPVRRRLLDAAGDIAMSEPEELAFQHSVCCQCALPTTKPPEGISIWEKRQGRAYLMVEAGKVIDPKTGQYIEPGLPYGPKARLLLIHLNSEAIRRQSPVIPVEGSMTAFFRRLMGKEKDGRQVRMLKAQLASLAAASLRISIAYDDDHAVQMNSHLVAAFDLWFPTEAGQRVLWPSTLRLSLDYFDSLTKYAVPLDERAIAALAHSAVALDIYSWLAQRLHRVPAGRPQLVPWTALWEQFGQGYAELRNFRPFFLRMLREVHAAYPEARIETGRRGISLWASPPPVRKLSVAVMLPQGITCNR
jgi:Plasmid encoded RepA protein